MISEVDIRDWEIVDEVMHLSNLKRDDVFSLENSKQLFEHWGNFNNSVYAGLYGSSNNIYCLPEFLKVYKWKRSEKTDHTKS